MSATLEPPSAPAEAVAPTRLGRAEGIELLGPLHGCGYRDGAALVRRADGQMVQLGALMYALLDCVDGDCDTRALAAELSQKLGRRVEERHVLRLAEKLAAQGLLAGSEHRAPPRRNPLLAMRWKVLVTNPKVTRLLTAPFAALFHPWILWPVLAGFVATLWFVLIHKGIASATSQAFHRPGLLLLVFALAVVSAGLHEFGHAAACRYGGATPGGMGMGIYMVWPAFYTDVTDAYRLPRRDRLRVDLGGLYFNAVVAVVTMAVWLATRTDALLLLVGLQVLQMVKQLSPVIRADGYHILSDATGVPDLFAHMGPTLRRLLPGHRREPSALTGRARFIVTAWVLVVVPVLVCLALSAVLMMPRLAASAWQSGHHILAGLPRQAEHGQIIDVLASLIRMLALALPVFGTVLVTQKIVRTTANRARDWSRGRVARQVVVALATTGILAGLAWAWWPAGQYQPVRARSGGTLVDLGRLVSAPAAAARPTPPPQPLALAPGRHLAMAMIPVGGASKRHPALFVISGGKGKRAVAILSTTAHAPGHGIPTMSTTTTATPAAGATTTTAAPAQATPAVAFPFELPKAPGPGGTQAVAVNTKDGGVTYDVAYSIVTVKHGAPVTNTNSAFAIASCHACTTVAVSFQIVLIVGESNIIAPINAAGALNVNCPACVTTAIADQLVLTIKRAPSGKLLQELNAALAKLNALSLLGAGGTPQAVAAEVSEVQQEVETELNDSGLLVGSSSSSSTSTGSGGSTSTTGTSTTPSSTTPSSTTTTPTQTTPTQTTTTPTQTTPAQTTTTTPAQTTPTQTTTTPTQTTPTQTTSTTSTTPTTTTSTTPTG